MRRYLFAVLILMTLSPAAGQQQPQKSIAEVARENREARLRKTVEDTVRQMCSTADDPKVQETYPGIKEACKDKPRLIQMTFESTLKKQNDENAKRLREQDSSWVSRALAAQSAPVDSVAAAQARVDRVCKHDLSMTPAEITSSMVDCDKAYRDLENTMRMQAAPQRSSPGASRTSAGRGDYLISLTGTPGLPVTGTCSFGGKSESYDDVLPAEHAVAAGRGVICSFVKKYVQGTLKMQISQNGTVRDQAETEASYGVVSLTVDW